MGGPSHRDRPASEDARPSVPDWVVHDLRRSMATHMERIGIEPHIIEVCLGHTLKGIAATYRHYSYLPEKERALQRWADELVPASAGSNLLAGDEGTGDSPVEGNAMGNANSAAGRITS